jgi:hypothetical protein
VEGLERQPSTGFPGNAKHTQVWRTANWHMTVMLTVTGLVIGDIIVRKDYEMIGLGGAPQRHRSGVSFRQPSRARR